MLLSPPELNIGHNLDKTRRETFKMESFLPMIVCGEIASVFLVDSRPVFLLSKYLIRPRPEFGNS